MRHSKRPLVDMVGQKVLLNIYGPYIYIDNRCCDFSINEKGEEMGNVSGQSMQWPAKILFLAVKIQHPGRAILCLDASEKHTCDVETS